MVWRLLLAASIAASLTISYLLPVSPLSRFVVAGLLFSIIGRLGFAILTRRRTSVAAPEHPPEARDYRKRGEASQNFRSAGEP
jgi:hypothetical protein